MRPLLDPTLQPLRRDAYTVQFGVHPGRAAGVAGLPPGSWPFLALLDGTRTLGALIEQASGLGLTAGCVHRLLALLAARGLLLDAEDLPPPSGDPGQAERLWPEGPAAALAAGSGDGGARALARRRAAMVHVFGGCRVGATLALLLAAAGVGGVTMRDTRVAEPADVVPGGLGWDAVGRPRSVAVHQAIRRIDPAVLTDVRALPDLAVLVGEVPPDPLHAVSLMDQGVPHLAVTVREAVGVIGPLVVPGGTACLECLERLRRDRDPGWPAIRAQLAERRVPPADVTLTTAVAAHASAQVLTYIQGGETVVRNGTIEIVMPVWAWRRRSWPPHPRCRCGRNDPAYLRMAA